MTKNISEEEFLLRKRARRRLLGAITLVITAVVILPMIFDDEPKLEQHEIAIHIPSEDTITDFSPTLLDSDKLSIIDFNKNVNPTEQLPIQSLDSTTISEIPVEKLVKKNSSPIPRSKPHFNKTEILPDSIASNNPVANMPGFVVQLGAFSDHSKARHQQQNLVVNGVKAYTETLWIDNKEIMRVRVGPFSTRNTAENELIKLKQLGLNGVVTAK